MMKGRSTIAIVAVAFGLGGLIGMLAWLASAYTKDDALSNAQPTWTEVAWPFATDEWGKGKAFQCKAFSCGTEINLYIRAKMGFCNCTTGIADDGDLDRMGDLDLIAGQVAALGNGRPITVAHMKCKNWYPTFRTVSDDHAHRATPDHRSVRTFAVKPRAFGAPLRGGGA